MPPKKQKKVVASLKEVLPAGSNPPRDGYGIRTVEVDEDPDRDHAIEPNSVFPEWDEVEDMAELQIDDPDGEDTIKTEAERQDSHHPSHMHDSTPSKSRHKKEKENLYEDDFIFYFPSSFMKRCSAPTYSRPERYVNESIKRRLSKLSQKTAAAESHRTPEKDKKPLILQRRNSTTYRMMRKNSSAFLKNQSADTSFEQRRGSVSRRKPAGLMVDTGKGSMLERKGSADSRYAHGNPWEVLQKSVPYKEIRVVDILSRDETEEEKIARLEMEALQEEQERLASKKKKVEKKKVEDDIPEGPKLVHEVKLSNIHMGMAMPDYSVWLASQLQLVKDRNMVDVKTGEPMWKKIYPQKHGFPVVSQTGKYWVKLYHLGKERMVEIDDRMPVDNSGDVMLPQCTKTEEIWPTLLVKAYLKLYNFKWYPKSEFNQEVGDGAFVYALTGLIPEHIPVSKLDKGDQWKAVTEFVSEERKQNEDTYVCCYCDRDFEPQVPSNIFRHACMAIMKTRKSRFTFNWTEVVRKLPGELLKGGNSHDGSPTGFSPMKSLNTSVADASDNEGADNPGTSKWKKKNHYIIPGYGYSLVECFQNGNVNMEYCREATNANIIEEVKTPLRITKKNTTKEERDMYRRKRREEKRKAEAELMDVLEKQLFQQPRQCLFIKIKSNAGMCPLLNVMANYTSEEIRLAKKCLLNGVAKPSLFHTAKYSSIVEADDGTTGATGPNGDVSDDVETQSVSTITVKKRGKKKLKEPEKSVSGTWMNYTDFGFCFQYMLIYRNINKNSSVSSYGSVWSNLNEAYEPPQDHQILGINTSEDYVAPAMTLEERLNEDDRNRIAREARREELQQLHQVSKGTFDKNIVVPLSIKPLTVTWTRDYPLEINFAFHPHVPAPTALTFPPIYMNIHQLGENGELKPRSAQLKGPVAGYRMLLEKGEYIFCPKISAPAGYVMDVSINANTTLETFSNSEYLIKSGTYHDKSLEVEYPQIEASTYALITKTQINVTKEDTELILSSKCSDPYLLNYVRLFLVDRRQPGGLPINKTVAECCWEEIAATKAKKFILSPNDDNGYLLMADITPPYHCAAGILNLEILTNDEELEVETVDHLDPIEYHSPYVIRKEGIIFRDLIYAPPNDNAIASFHLRMLKGFREVPDSKTKKKDDDPFTGEEVEPPVERNVIFEIFDNDELIYATRGVNKACIPHFVFRGNKELKNREDIPQEEQSEDQEYAHSYLLQARYDLRTWPDAIVESTETKDLFWVLRIVPTNTMALILDTRKEDAIRNLKQGWEATETGRSERAKQSRVKHVLRIKKLQGLSLTEDEEEVLAAPRIEKAEEKGAKKKKPAPEKPKKDKKGKIIEEPQERTELRVAPDTRSHKSIVIKTFLNHATGNRLVLKEAMKGKRPISSLATIDTDSAAVHSYRTSTLTSPTSGTYSTRSLYSATSSLSRLRSPEEKVFKSEKLRMKNEDMLSRLAREREKFEETKKARTLSQDTELESFRNARLQLAASRSTYVVSRNRYRDMMMARREKEVAIQRLMSGDEKMPDIAAIETLIEEAIGARVNIKMLAGLKKVHFKVRREVYGQQILKLIQTKNVDGLKEALESDECKELRITRDIIEQAKYFIENGKPMPKQKK